MQKAYCPPCSKCSLQGRVPPTQMWNGVTPYTNVRRGTPLWGKVPPTQMWNWVPPTQMWNGVPPYTNVRWGTFVCKIWLTFQYFFHLMYPRSTHLPYCRSPTCQKHGGCKWYSNRYKLGISWDTYSKYKINNESLSLDDNSRFISYLNTKHNCNWMKKNYEGTMTYLAIPLCSSSVLVSAETSLAAETFCFFNCTGDLFQLHLKLIE